MRNTGAIIAVVVVVLLLVLLFGGFGMMGFGGMMNGYGMMGPNGTTGHHGYGYGPLGGILSLVFFGLLIAGAVLLILWLVRNAGAGAMSLRRPGEMPLDIVKTRYAKGEITKEQYDAMRRDLEG